MNINAIANSNKQAKKNKKEYFLFKDILLLLQHNIEQPVDIHNVCRRIEKNIPKKLFKDLDYIYVGKFEELDLRQVQSAYLRGAIYISSQNLTEESLYEAIIHELGHSTEEMYRESIYGDSELAAEFVGKRKKLRSILKAQELEYEDPMAFIRLEYNPQFDNFLYNVVGYDRLNQICTGLFPSAYGTTSLREYYANGFEYFYNGDREYLSKISPKLFSKISKLTKKAA